MSSEVFVAAELPALVFQPIITSCAWLRWDDLCCIDGWSFLRALARQHGDTCVRLSGIDLQQPRVVTLQADSDPDAYRAVCDDEIVYAGTVRSWGASGRWGIHGSSGFEIAVAGQVDEASWPRSRDCGARTIDSALRVAWCGEDARRQLLTTYDAVSWDPALEDHRALPELRDLCGRVLADQVDPVVAIRDLVELLNRVPKHVRRIPATGRLHQAWTRTYYILLGDDRAPWGPLLLAQNDRNHERHAVAERPLVRQACEEILAASSRARSG